MPMIGTRVSKCVIALAALLLLTVASPVAAQAPAIPPNSGDCNFNGTPDFQEANWANRDDDGDGVCNAIDVNPLEAGVADMQAITVPARGNELAAPHVTYSGAVHTLKGIARYGGNQFMWDFGDGSAPMAWTAIANSYDLGVNHTYTGAVGQVFTATLSIRNSAVPSNVATAEYSIAIKDAGAALNTLTRAQTDVRAQVAIDRALWYLHTNLSRSSYADGAPGYAQRYAVIQSPALAMLGDTCLTTQAFVAQGHTATGDYHADPYVENVRRGLNYMLANSATRPITTQQSGNPDVNGNGIGVTMGPADTYTQGVCAMAFAESADPAWLAGTGPSGVYGRPHSAVSQDLVDWFAYGQAEQSSGVLPGGWGDQANAAANNMQTRWPVMALRSNAARMGATVPGFVRDRLIIWTLNTQNPNPTSLNGSVGLETAADFYDNVPFTSGLLLGHALYGNPMTTSSVQRALGFIARSWQQNDFQWHTNLGDSNAMFSVSRAFRTVQPAIRTISDYDYVNNVVLPGAFNWYYGPTGAPQNGYAGNAIARQTAGGNFTDTSILLGNPISGFGATAMTAMVLSSGGAAGTADLSVSNLDFGTVDLNSTTGPRLVLVTNNGDFDMLIDSISVTGPFALTSDCGNVVSPAGEGDNTCAIEVTFTPTTPGAATGVITVAGASGSPSSTISLSGFGYTSKLTPIISWPTPAPITFGTALGATQLNALADVEGEYSYTPSAGTALNAGAGQSLTVTFTPKNTAGYNSATATVFIDVAPATPALTWPAPASIAYGTALDGTQLNASANVPGSYVYEPAAGVTLNAGAGQALKVTFTPDDANNYTGATITTTITVAPIGPSLTVTGGTFGFDNQPHASTSTALGINGEPLGPVVITYNGQSILPVNAGSYAVLATLDAAGNYRSATASATITITKAISVIAWSAPASVPAGTVLSATQLNATANVPGTFAYTPAAGTVLTAGTQPLTVVFTPNDVTNYDAGSASTTLVVTAAPPPPPPAATGRMSGGGGIDSSITHARFELEISVTANGATGELRFRTHANGAGRHDRDDDDDLKALWDRFVSTTITSAGFENLPAAPGGKRSSGIDAVTFQGTGRWNNQPGYAFEARASDAGEPGRGVDRFTLVVRAPNGSTVASVDGVLTGGNIQAHK